MARYYTQGRFDAPTEAGTYYIPERPMTVEQRVRQALLGKPVARGRAKDSYQPDTGPMPEENVNLTQAEYDALYGPDSYDLVPPAAPTAQSDMNLGAGAGNVLMSYALYDALTHGAAGAAPSTPAVIGGFSPPMGQIGASASTAGGESLLGSVAWPLAASAALDLGARASGSNTLNSANSTMNPVGIFHENMNSLDEIRGGERLGGRDQEIALAGGLPTVVATGGTSLLVPWGYNQLFAEGGLFGSSKSPEQQERDAVRGILDELGVTTRGEAAVIPGTDFNIDMEGRGRELQNYGLNTDERTTRHRYDIDWSDPNVNELVGAADPLAAFYVRQAGLSDKPGRVADLTGYIVNSGQAGVRGMYDRFNELGGSRDILAQSVWDDYNDGNITAEVRNARLAAIDKQYGVENPNQGLGGEAEFGAAYITPGQEEYTIEGKHRPINRPRLPGYASGNKPGQQQKQPETEYASGNKPGDSKKPKPKRKITIKPKSRGK